MMNIRIGDQELSVKDYHCAYENEYLPQFKLKLWLYVNICDICNGKCKFCINRDVEYGHSVIDTLLFLDILKKIKEHIYGVSITGGEPMLYPEQVDRVIKIVKDECGSNVELDLVSNGTRFTQIQDLIEVNALDSIHISRHMINDDDNAALFGFQTASFLDIKNTISNFDDPAQIVLNCVLMTEGVDSLQKMAEYLEFAANMGVRNVCFIGLSRHNTFCSQHYIDPYSINLSLDNRFHIWNKFHDHEYCSCSSGSYDALNGSIRFYFRRIGVKKAPYARQLVYTADNRLIAGFSGKEINFNNNL